MSIVLVVEDELSTRLLHARALARLDGVIALSSASLAEAKEVLKHEHPSVVVVDIRLGDGSGLDVLRMLEERQAFPLVIVVSGYLNDLRQPVWPSSRFRVMPKPVDLAWLQRTVGAHLGRPASHQPFTAAEYVQLACLGGHSVRLGVTGLLASGCIVVVDGVVWAAQWGNESGLEAFTHAVSESQVQVSVGALPEPLPARQLAGEWQELLMEAARLTDEATASGASLAHAELDFSDVFEEATSSSSEQAAVRATAQASGFAGPDDPVQLVASGVRAVIARRYQDAVVAFERALALNPDSQALKHRLQRLRELGY